MSWSSLEIHVIPVKDGQRTDEGWVAFLGGKALKMRFPLTCHWGGIWAPKPKAGNILSLKRKKNINKILFFQNKKALSLLTIKSIWAHFKNNFSKS